MIVAARHPVSHLPPGDLFSRRRDARPVKPTTLGQSTKSGFPFLPQVLVSGSDPSTAGGVDLLFFFLELLMMLKSKKLACGTVDRRASGTFGDR
jgi:hypothetical protein